MIKNIEMQQEKNRYLKKTKISLEKQNYNGKLDHMYFTKLDFAGLESELSPFCALIIFDHTDLSLCCLQTLQKLSITSKTVMFFSQCAATVQRICLMCVQMMILKYI